MANQYTVDKKHHSYYFLDTNDLDNNTNNYEITQNLFNKWVKIDTSDSDFNLLLPNNVYNGFSCVIENVGDNKINYITPPELILRTDEEKYTDTRFRSVEINFDKENNEWRIQGYIGVDDINSIYDVKTNQDGAPSQGNTLTFDEETGFWKAAPNPPFLTKRDKVITSDFIISNSDHNSFIVVDTTDNPVGVALNLGLKPGLHFKVLNISNGSLNLITAGTLIGPSTTSIPNTYLEVHHLKDDIYYSVLVGQGESPQS